MFLKNNLQKKLYLLIVFIAILLLTIPDAISQNTFENSNAYTDKDIELFIEANKKATKIQQNSQEKMIETIKKEGIEVEKFNQIMNSQQKNEEVNATQAEIAAFSKAMQSLQQIQKEVEQKIEKTLEEGIGAEKYKEMMLAYQQDTDFQQKVNSFMN